MHVNVVEDPPTPDVISPAPLADSTLSSNTLPTVVQSNKENSEYSMTYELTARDSLLDGSGGSKASLLNDRASVLSSSTPSDELLTFLEEHASCLKGSPKGFRDWLSKTEDVTSLLDLAEAVADEEYLGNVLHLGDGVNGIKGFKRKAFKVAVEKAIRH